MMNRDSTDLWLGLAAILLVAAMVAIPAALIIWDLTP